MEDFIYDDAQEAQDPTSVDYYEEFDTNGDGFTDVYAVGEDTTGDGQIDHIVMVSDNDYNGTFETTTEALDADNNGSIETLRTEVDTNDDNKVDLKITEVDLTGDGMANTTEVLVDTTHNGNYDTYEQHQDLDGDGNDEIVIKGMDTSNNGEFDSIRIFEDTNYNGKMDTVTEYYDSNNDDNIDTAVMHHDYDEDGKEDWKEMYAYDTATGNLTPLNDQPAYGNTLAGTYAWELNQYEPDSNYPEGISGDPTSSMEHWEYQGDTNRCALYSQMFIIEEFTGQDIDIDEFAQMATDNGWFGVEGSGTALLNINRMLDTYGIENEMTFHNDINDLENCLNNGGRVIVAIDADEIWYGDGEDYFSPNSRANHAVEVIGVDRTDPEHPMVILNDSGTPNGRGEMVPLEDFIDAWQDSECQMVACYPNN